MNRAIRIGLVELPEVGVFDSRGRNRASARKGSTLLSKQILMASLEALGYDVQLFNLKDGDFECEYGRVQWGDTWMTKVYVGREIQGLDPAACDVWGITNNFAQFREVACIAIAHLLSQGKPVVVGGSDVIAVPDVYRQAGASLLVLDKSGAANAGAIEFVLGRRARTELSGVMLPDGSVCHAWAKPLSPEDWPLPSIETARACMGTEYWSSDYPAHFLPVGSLFTDIGCDRKCDFCQTPSYKLGYRGMSPRRVRQWLERLKEAGAGSIINGADQFLGRMVWKEGRDDVLEIMRTVRELDLVMLWPNGLELRKATLGRGFNRQDTDLRPDEELIQAVWGWDGRKGVFHAYIPAERPLAGRENYAKLLPWREHGMLMKEIVRAGVPALSYGVIIGFEDETNETLLRLEDAVYELHAELLKINPQLIFQLSPFAISPIPGTPQDQSLRAAGLLQFDDPTLYGGLWTPSVNTRALTFQEIANWQIRLLNIGTQAGRSLFINTDFSETKQEQTEQRAW